MWRFRSFLPLSPGEEPITLGEGDTPLLGADAPARRLGLANLWIKDEGTNPTGSFKARGLSAADHPRRSRRGRAVRAADRGQCRRRRCRVRRPGRSAGPGLRADARPRERSWPRSLVFGGDLVLLDGHIGDCGAGGPRLRRRDRGRRSLHPARALSDRGQEDAGPGARACSSAGRCRLRSSIPTGGGTGLIGMWKAFLRAPRRRAGSRASCHGCTRCRAAAARRVVRAFESGARPVRALARSVDRGERVSACPARWATA